MNEKFQIILNYLSNLPFYKIIYWIVSRWKKILILSIIALGFYFGFLVGGSYFLWKSKRNQITTELENFKIATTEIEDVQNRKPIKIFDKKGVLIGEFLKEKMYPVREDNLSSHKTIIWAIVASEDKDFFNHSGINFISIFRALFTGIIHFSKPKGVSTISQQLAKYLLDLGERNLFNKFVEIYCTVFIEKNYSKSTILSLYLNSIYLGEGNIGVEEASRYYYQKKASELTIAEAALLTGIIPAPSIYNPIKNLKYSLEKQETVLNSMKKFEKLKIYKNYFRKLKKWEIKNELNSFYKQYNIKENKRTKILEADFSKKSVDKNFEINLAPQFNQEIRQFVLKNFSDLDLRTVGLNIYTTLDYEKQKNADISLGNGIQKVVGNLQKNKQRYYKKKKLDKFELTQEIIESLSGNLISFNAESGGIEAFSSKSENDLFVKKSSTFYDKRQPGSTIKALLYALAFEKKIIHPSSILKDEKINFNGYSPTNWYKGYKGDLTARQAFALSTNTIAVKLLDEIGVENFLEKLGLILGLSQEEIENRFQNNLSLALGSGELSPLELTQIYSTILNLGKKAKIKMINRVTDHEGNLIFSDLGENDINEGKYLLDPIACLMVLDLMNNVTSNQGTFPINNPTEIKIGGKTGTVEISSKVKDRWLNLPGIKDAWFVGYFSNIITTVWIGNDWGGPFPGSGSSVAGRIWLDYFLTSKDFIDNRPLDLQNLPPNYVTLDICFETGKIVMPNTTCLNVLKSQYYYIGALPEFEEASKVEESAKPIVIPEPIVEKAQ